MSEVKIKAGYCFETDAREPADYAVKKRDEAHQNHHYFCISKDCAAPLRPAHWHETGVAWYRTDATKPDHKHVISCAYGALNGAGASVTRNHTPHRADQTQRVIVPNLLGEGILQRINSWPEHAPPTRDQIALMAAKAKLLPIPGNLEEVVTAHERVKGERSEYGLTINGRLTNYAAGFSWLWDIPPPPWKPEDWKQNIVTAYCKVNSGQRAGIWFVNVSPSSKGKYAGSGLRLSLMVRADDLAVDPKKKQYESFLAAAAITGQTVKLYWQGDAPAESQRGFTLTGPRPISARFALRQIPSPRS